MRSKVEGLRRFPRRAFAGDVFVMDEDGFGFVLEASDLSRGGVFLKTSLLLEEGERCYLRFALETGETISARGEVRRTYGTPLSRYPAGFAIAFDEMDEGSRQALDGATRPERAHAAA